MKINNSGLAQGHELRLGRFSVMLSMAATLTACGGGEEVSLQLTQQRSQLTSVTPSSGNIHDDSGLLEHSLTLPPAQTDLEFDQATRDLFMASMQASNQIAKSSSLPNHEKAQALHDLEGHPRGDARVKWNPGHYIAIPRPNDPEVRATLRQIDELPHVKGLLIRYSWSSLEPRKGEYNFSAIERDLSLVAEKGKRLFIMLSTKDFNGDGAVPDYLRTSEYDKGAYKIDIDAWEGRGRSGENIALYNDNVRDRLIALTKALGNRYNRHNKVEGITFNETAMGQATKPLNASQKFNWFINLAQVNRETNKAFPNTVVMQFVNFPRTHINGLVENMLDNGVALGGPDIFFHDEDLNRYVYPYYDSAKGKVPIGPSVQPENYMTTAHQGNGPAPKVQDLYNFGKSRLHANYMFWTKYNPRPTRPYDDAIRMFSSSSFPKDSAGGLNKNCPTSYVACVNEL